MISAKKLMLNLSTRCAVWENLSVWTIWVESWSVLMTHSTHCLQQSPASIANKIVSSLHSAIIIFSTLETFTRCVSICVLFCDNWLIRTYIYFWFPRCITSLRLLCFVFYQSVSILHFCEIKTWHGSRIRSHSNLQHPTKFRKNIWTQIL